MADAFGEHLRQWQEWTAAPWGRIRFAVVQETLSSHVAALGGGRLRVLDVGGGDARDSLPLAQAGHDVTVLDPSDGMLEVARARAAEVGVGLTTTCGGLDDLPRVEGEFDLVLCHFVLHYRPPDADADDVRRLADKVRPGGRLSVIAPNPAGFVLQKLVREGPGPALGELDLAASASVTFGEEMRRVDPESVVADLRSAGLELVGRHGGRIANDLLTDDAAKHDPAHYAELERLELALCDREPFKRFGAFWQLVGAKTAS